MTGATFVERRGAGFWELAGAEFVLNLRSAGWRVLCLLLGFSAVGGLAMVRYLDPGALRPAEIAGDVVRASLEGLLLFLAPALVCGAALRENRLEMDDLILSKPPSSETLVWGKFAGIAGALLLSIPLAVGIAAVGFTVLFWPALPSLGALLPAFRVALPLLFVCGLSFCLALFFRTVMVAGLAIGLQLAIGLGAGFMVPAMRYTLTPYHGAYALLGLTLVAAVAGWWHRERASRILRPVWAMAAVGLVAALGSGLWSIAAWRGWSTEPDPALVSVVDWKGKDSGPLPDLALPTLAGGQLSLRSWQGKPLIVVFWSTASARTAGQAAVLERAWRASGAEAKDGTAFVSVCVTNDPHRGQDLARIAGLTAPALWNPPAQFDQPCGLAGSFEINHLDTALAMVVRKDGSVSQHPVPVLQVPQPAPRNPPRRAWEQQLQEKAVRVFRRLGEETSADA